MTRKSDPRSVLTTLRETGACLDGHFRLSSGVPSDQSFQCALALSRPDRAEGLARGVAPPVVTVWSLPEAKTRRTASISEHTGIGGRLRKNTLP